MEWISVKERLPPIEMRGTTILILVNGAPFFCEIMLNEFVYVLENHFYYSCTQGWCSDKRFADPTHWMPLPEFP